MTPTINATIPFGLCHCGCGETTGIATKSDKYQGHVRGKPYRYCRYHRARKHGHSSAVNGRASRTYQSWSQMKSRCLNPKHHGFFRYGGRGISVCERWVGSFANFLKDMGKRPPGLSLERLDNNGNYEPQNCKWATALEQGSNKSSNHFLTWNGVRYPLRQLCRIRGISDAAFRKRLKRMSLADAMSFPPTKGKNAIQS